MKLFASTLLIAFACIQLNAQDIPEWRNTGRTGIYNETGLLKQWPETGPKMLWSIEDLPMGYSSLTIKGNTAFMTGMIGTGDYVIAVGLDGKVKWKTEYGRSWNNNFPDSRVAPTIDGNRLYATSGLGDMVCMNNETGEIIWKQKASEDFGGTFGPWGISESPIVYDGKVFYTPGGEQTTMVALDKMTGKTIWKSESLKDKPSYVSPLLIDRNGKKLIINVTENYVIGVQPEDGKILWKYDFGQHKDAIIKANIQTNTPVYHDGKIFITHGYNHKSVMLNLSEDATSVSLAWIDSTLDVHHGGVVLVDGYIYGANWKHNRMGKWCCLDWETGEVKYETKWQNKGSIIYAEGMLYCYEEKGGNIALVKATPDEFKVTSSFKIELGKGPHWGHPVIHKGILYVRHENALMAFDIKAK